MITSCCSLSSLFVFRPRSAFRGNEAADDANPELQRLCALLGRVSLLVLLSDYFLHWSSCVFLVFLFRNLHQNGTVNQYLRADYFRLLLNHTALWFHIDFVFASHAGVAYYAASSPPSLPDSPFRPTHPPQGAERFLRQ